MTSLGSPIIQPADIEWRGNTPFSRTFQDIYYQPEHGLAETRHVFIQANRLHERWTALPAGASFTIIEMGFGTGLNFLATWQAWQQTATAAHCHLHYVSIERHPLHLADLDKALSAWPELKPHHQALSQAYPWLTPGFHRRHFAKENISLTLIFDDAINALGALYCPATGLADAWFLDGFNPAHNPAMWQQAVYQRIARLSKPHATLSTFSAARAVREGLQTCGFYIEKIPGFHRKRDMTRGELVTNPADRDSNSPPWYELPTPIPPSQHRAIVIGAGLAGCATVHHLQRRGWEVVLIDQHAKPAQAASGNAQGIFYPWLSQDFNAISQLSVAAYDYALHHWQQLEKTTSFSCTSCGVLQLDKHRHAQTWLAKHHFPDALVCALDVQQASQKAGIHLQQGGLWFPQAGWLAPAELCQAWLTSASAGLHTYYGQAITHAVYHDGHWRVYNDVSCIAEAPLLIVATGYALKNMPLANELPLQTTYGEMHTLPVAGQSANLQCVVCHDTYLTPAHHDQHSLGASYTMEPSSQLHQNLAGLAAWQAPLAQAFAHVAPLQSRMAQRLSSRDHLPLVGPWPNIPQQSQDYRELWKGRPAHRYPAASYYPGLYINAAYGSRGITHTPLFAEFLVNQWHGEAWPLPKHSLSHLTPNRFLIRQRTRHKDVKDEKEINFSVDLHNRISLIF